MIVSIDAPVADETVKFLGFCCVFALGANGQLDL